MSQIKSRIQIPDEKSPIYREQMERELTRWSRVVQDVVNGGLTFADNMQATVTTVADTGVADTEFIVGHNLKRVPSGFIVLNIDAAGVVYDSGTAWTTSAIYLKCSAASAAVKLAVVA